MRDLVAVECLVPVTAPTGGHWNVGEVAGFEPDVAASLIKRGAARAVKAPSVSPANKAILGAPYKKQH